MSNQELTQEKTLETYADGFNQLAEALKGLTDSHLDLSRDKGKWSIRQIVHHIVDVEDIWKTCIKGALANPGCTIDMTWYIVDNKCAGPLDYAHRPIAETIDLFKAMRHHVVEFMNNLPNTWETNFTTIWSNQPNGLALNVGGLIAFLCTHLEGHINQIRETREKHNI